MTDTKAPLYQPYYCEENIWHLARSLRVQNCHHNHFVAFISNPTKSCALRHQRAAAPGEIIFWDYHVILLTQDPSWKVWDLDSTLGIPLDARSYLQQTFSGAEQWPKLYQPLFRLIDADTYLTQLSTDRSHMRTPHGIYTQPPPPWPPPYQPEKGMNLMQFVDVTRPFFGEILDLPTLLARVSKLPHTTDP